MTDMNYERMLQSFFLLNLEIEKRFFKQTKFLDKEVETNYRIESYANSKKKKLYSDAFIILSYVAIIAYICIHCYGNVFLYVSLGCLGVSLIMIGLSYIYKKYWFDLVINHIMIFLISIFLNWKIIYIAYYISTPDNFHDGEIIRTIVYNFVATNILAYVTLDSRFLVSTSLFLLNLAATTVVQIKLNSNEYYFIDGLANVPVAIFFYLFKKASEESDRNTFADKYRLEKFYCYTRDFIKGINAFYLNISKDFSICCDSKMISLLQGMHIDRYTGKSMNQDQIIEIGDISQENKNNEIKSLIASKASISEENYGNFSAEVLDLFSLYNEEGWRKGNSTSTKENLGKTLKLSMLGPSMTNFKTVGIFKLETFGGIKYFDVHFRKFNLSQNSSVNDVLMYDVTVTITSRQKLFEGGIMKEKIMAKIIHEFKTPINSIIGVIGNIEDALNSINIQDKITMRHLDTIRNLSSYVIFLISDIIHFSNIKSFEEINIIPQIVDLRDIANFSFDILRSLLRCSQSKSQAIHPALDFEDEIDNLNIKADEARLKQIMLNIISNAVKFTKSGVIKIRCSIQVLKQIVLVSISDTGIGIRANEQEKLFNDFQMIKTDDVSNAMGSGLGLSICKSLASAMGIQISTTSIYGEGSDFSLAIPYLPHSPINKSLVNIFHEETFSEPNLTNEIELQEWNVMNSDRKLPSELSYHFGLDLKNRNPMIEPNRKQSQVFIK